MTEYTERVILGPSGTDAIALETSPPTGSSPTKSGKASDPLRISPPGRIMWKERNLTDAGRLASLPLVSASNKDMKPIFCDASRKLTARLKSLHGPQDAS